MDRINFTDSDQVSFRQSNFIDKLRENPDMYKKKKEGYMLLRITLILGALCLIFSPDLLTAKPAKPYLCNEKPVLVLYYSPYCGYSQMVLNYLKQIHKTVPMKNVIDNPTAKDELKRYGGKLQVPCLFIDQNPLYESDKIIQWLSQNQDYLDSV